MLDYSGIDSWVRDEFWGSAFCNPFLPVFGLADHLITCAAMHAKDASHTSLVRKDLSLTRRHKAGQWYP